MRIYNKCMAHQDMAPEFCNKFFGKTEVSRGLYHSIGEKINDIVIISDNLYTNYGLLFLILGVILTMALLSALAILKSKGPKE